MIVIKTNIDKMPEYCLQTILCGKIESEDKE